MGEQIHQQANENLDILPLLRFAKQLHRPLHFQCHHMKFLMFYSTLFSETTLSLDQTGIREWWSAMV